MAALFCQDVTLCRGGWTLYRDDYNLVGMVASCRDGCQDGDIVLEWLQFDCGASIVSGTVLICPG